MRKITFEKDVDLQIEMAVTEQLGNSVFIHAAAVAHFIGMEMDHISALTRRVIRAYLAVRIKTHAKHYSKAIGNILASRHEMTKLKSDFDTRFRKGNEPSLLDLIFSMKTT